MPYFQNIVPKGNKRGASGNENRSIILKLYNKTTIPQLGICSITIKQTHTHTHTQIVHAVSGNSLALLGIPDMHTLDVLAINCSTINTQTSSTQINKKQTGDWGNTNKE